MATDAGNDKNKGGAVAPSGEARAVERVRVKVNGVEIEVTEEVLVRELVAKAKDKGAIAGYVNEYVVERTTEGGEFGIDETIRISDQEELLAVPEGGTTVA